MKQTNWRLDFDSLVDPGGKQAVQRLSVSQLLRCRQEIWGPWNYHHQFQTRPSPWVVCEIYWVVSKWLLGKGEHSPLVSSSKHTVVHPSCSLQPWLTTYLLENVEEMPKSSILLTRWPIVKDEMNYLAVENMCSFPMWWITWSHNTAGEMFSVSAGGQSWCLVLLCFSLCTVVLQRGLNLVSYTHCLRSWHINVVKEMIILLPWRVFGTSSR